MRVGPYVMPHFGPDQINDFQLSSLVRYVELTKNPDDRGGWALGHVGPVPEGMVAWLLAGTALVLAARLIGKRARMKRWLIALLMLLLGRGRRPLHAPPPEPRASTARRRGTGSEFVVALLLLVGGGARVAFVVVYALGADTQLLGLTLAARALLLRRSRFVFAKRLVPQEESDEPYPERAHRRGGRGRPHRRRERQRPDAQKLLVVAAGGAGAAIGVARRSLRSPRSARSSTPPPAVASPWRHAAAGSSTRRAARCVPTTIESSALFTRVPGGRGPERPRRADRGRPRSTRPNSTSPEPGGLGARGDPRLLEDLHPRRLRRLALPLRRSIEPTSRRTGARLPVPLLDVRPGRRAARSLFGPAGRPLPQLPLRSTPRRRWSRPAASPGRSARPGGECGSDDPRARPLPRRAHAARAAASARRSATCSPTTGRSCSARSRSTASSSSSSRGSI